MSDPPIDYHVAATDATVNSCWDNSLDPVVTVDPGSVVQFECLDVHSGRLGPESTASDLAALDTDSVHPLTGPVAVEGARPGDALVVELLDLEHHGWGFTGVLPGEVGLGLLADEFPDPAYHYWELDGDVGRFVDGIEVPLDPFPGNLGVAPEAPGEHSTIPPRRVGGNLDVKHLTAGAAVHFPVAVDGALFSIGDCHAAQGDGEVCGNGIEAPMTVTCRFDVYEDADLDAPRFSTTGPFSAGDAAGPVVGTMGVEDDLRAAARSAVRSMLDHLVAERGLTRTEAYVLCSAAVDLKINEVVNAPNWVVSAYLPECIFP